MGIRLVDWEEGVTLGTLQKHLSICHPDLKLKVEINGKMHSITGLSQYRPLEDKNILMVAHVAEEGSEVTEWKMTKSTAQPVISSGPTQAAVTEAPSAS